MMARMWMDVTAGGVEVNHDKDRCSTEGQDTSNRLYRLMMLKAVCEQQAYTVTKAFKQLAGWLQARHAGSKTRQACTHEHVKQNCTVHTLSRSQRHCTCKQDVLQHVYKAVHVGSGGMSRQVVKSSATCTLPAAYLHTCLHTPKGATYTVLPALVSHGYCMHAHMLCAQMQHFE